MKNLTNLSIVIAAACYIAATPLPVKYDGIYTAGKEINITIDVAHREIAIDGQTYTVSQAKMVNDLSLQFYIISQDDSSLEVPSKVVIRPSFLPGKYKDSLLMYSENLDFIFTLVKEK